VITMRASFLVSIFLLWKCGIAAGLDRELAPSASAFSRRREARKQLLRSDDDNVTIG
jgi:hypothetical protein